MKNNFLKLYCFQHLDYKCYENKVDRFYETMEVIDKNWKNCYITSRDSNDYIRQWTDSRTDNTTMEIALFIRFPQLSYSCNQCHSLSVVRTSTHFSRILWQTH